MFTEVCHHCCCALVCVFVCLIIFCLTFISPFTCWRFLFKWRITICMLVKPMCMEILTSIFFFQHCRLAFFFSVIWFLRTRLDFIIICVLFAGCCCRISEKIRHCSNCGVAYSGPASIYCEKNNKMEVKRYREGKGGKQGSLVTEGMIYWSRLTGCCGPINPDGQEEPVRRFSWVVRVTQTTGNGSEINSSTKRHTWKDRWTHGWLDER